MTILYRLGSTLISFFSPYIAQAILLGSRLYNAVGPLLEDIYTEGSNFSYCSESLPTYSPCLSKRTARGLKQPGELVYFRTSKVGL